MESRYLIWMRLDVLRARLPGSGGGRGWTGGCAEEKRYSSAEHHQTQQSSVAHGSAHEIRYGK